ncbi:MAG TPA: YihY/virulence factor BrkB family protein [Solirubrobacteraceae bacterium]|jgi:membrane protein|nr:YihY/virulence factor BrkB family protein [Solirubrobacteraceae bacterium]
MTEQTRTEGAQQQEPEQPTDVPRPAWGGVLKRTVREFQGDNLTDLAAALTYYGVLAIFPMLIVIVSVLGLIGNSVTRPLLQNVSAIAPGPAQSILKSAITNIQAHQGTAGVLFIVGLLAALWSASSYIAAFMRASNIVWDVPEGRPFYKTIPIRLGVTLITVVLLTVSAVAVVLTGSLAGKLGNVIGVGSTAVTIWDIAKWPVMVVLVSIILGILYYAAPNVRQPGFAWVSPGSVLAVVLWLVISALFALYVASFSSYNKTYGALASVVVFLMWLWLTNVAILLGAEFNAELERGRQIIGGHPPEKEPYLPLRNTPKPRKAIT